jgi:hypothetical protein
MIQVLLEDGLIDRIDRIPAFEHGTMYTRRLLRFLHEPRLHPGSEVYSC